MPELIRVNDVSTIDDIMAGIATAHGKHGHTARPTAGLGRG